MATLGMDGIGDRPLNLAKENAGVKSGP